MSTHKFKTDMPVMLAPKNGQGTRARLQIKFWHGLLLLVVFLFSSTIAYSQGSSEKLSVLDTLFRWMPLLMKGFVFNLVISVAAMAIGTISGAALGLGQVSIFGWVRKFSWFITQFFRNSPWLVLLFFAMFLLPFEFRFGSVVIPLPDWAKAIIGLSLPVMANVSEIVRGAVVSLPSGQWESAESLAFSRQQTLWRIILPQCVKRMLPPWMNLYAILTMATVLASIVGVSEVMTLTGEALAAESGRSELLIPFYSFVLFLFFIYCYPIARWTLYLENKFSVKT